MKYFMLHLEEINRVTRVWITPPPPPPPHKLRKTSRHSTEYSIPYSLLPFSHLLPPIPHHSPFSSSSSFSASIIILLIYPYSSSSFLFLQTSKVDLLEKGKSMIHYSLFSSHASQYISFHPPPSSLFSFIIIFYLLSSSSFSLCFILLSPS